MQIFIPFADLKKLFAVLDKQRLGIQRNEAYMTLSICMGRMQPKNPRTLKSHLILMWKPYTVFLQKYYNMCIAEWTSRGFKNNLKLEEFDEKDIVTPPWWGDEELHASHRGNLIRKNPSYYKDELGWTDEPRDGYLWIVDGKRILVDNSARQAAKKNNNNNEDNKETSPKRKRATKGSKKESKEEVKIEPKKKLKVKATRKKPKNTKEVVDLTEQQV